MVFGLTRSAYPAWPVRTIFQDHPLRSVSAGHLRRSMAQEPSGEETAVPRARAASLAATAQLEGWRPPVSAALQPVVLLDATVEVMALSVAAERLLVLGGAGRPLRDAVALKELDGQWDGTPFVRAARDGEPSRDRLELPAAGLVLEVSASPLYGTAGVIGAMAFLSVASV